MTLWSVGLAGLITYLSPAMPRLAPAMLLLLLFGTRGGMAFGFQGFFEAAFGADQKESLAALDAYPLEATLLLWIPGPVMPSALLLLSLLLAWRRLVPIWAAALLAVGAIRSAAFPASTCWRTSPTA